MVTARYALLDGATVVNVVMWDGDTTHWNPAPLTAVPYDPAVHSLTPDTTTANRATIEGRLRTAYDANVTFLGLASPTNAQVIAQVQRLTREVNALIRLTLQQLDTTDGT